MSEVNYDDVFDKVREKVLNEVLDPSESLPELVYHYTNTPALLAMASADRGSFWATDYRYLNDPTELQVFRDAFERELLKVGGNSSLEALRATTQNVLREEKREGGWTDVFVASFSKEPDLLSQWRAYGDGGSGFSVGLRIADLNDCAPAGMVLHMAQVTYDEAPEGGDEPAATRIAKQLIKDHVATFEQQLKEFPQTEGVLLNHASQSLLVGQASVSTLFKHSGYKEEREVRIVCIRHRRNDAGIKGVKFRAQAGGLPIAYIELRPDGGLPIREVIVGPKLDFGRAHASLLTVFAGRNPSVVIKPSKTAYRG